MFSLEGKKALVTGGSRGIGRGICLSLAKQKASVAINYHTNLPKAQEVLAEIQREGGEGWIISADVSDAKAVAQMFAEIKNRWNRLDILVNNAGIVSFSPLETLSEEEWDKVMETNLKSQFLCVKEAVKIMPPGGRIINIASIASGGVGVGFNQLCHYVSSKGGIIGLTESLALELGPKGINVNAVAPGVIETDMTKGITDNEETKRGLLARIPKGRFGKPEDIGAAVAFLASPEADYITGTVLYVDGGWLAV